MQAAFIHSADLAKWSYPPDCPFSSQRAGATCKLVASMGLLSGPDRRQVAPRPADAESLLTFHERGYIEALRAASGGHPGREGLDMGLGTPDCPVFEGLWDYAVLACGASLAGARLILDGRVRAAFNPSGGYHHAHAGRAAGFCYLNDVVIACMHLASAGKRVLYLDIDVHHGDGVQEAFYDRRDVMTISFHESGRTLFPGTGWPGEIGRGRGAGYSVNVPLPVGTHDEAFGRAFDQIGLPLIEAFSPDVIVMQLGMDMLAGDPLAHLALTNNSHADVIEAVLGFDRPVLAVGGGGYHFDNTVRGWSLAWSILCSRNDETANVSAGLRDSRRALDDSFGRRIQAAVDEVIEEVKERVFAYHGL